MLSSFADPFRKTTKVELGCLLTYLSDLKEPEKTTGRQQQCLNGYTEYPADSLVPYPVRAKDVMARCLQRLGLTASFNPLTNNFNVAEFDFSSGYVSVLSDLLRSESFLGYLDETEKLRIVSLTSQGGTGPQLTADHVIDLGSIGVGDLPGEAIAVAYNSFQTDKDYDLTAGGKETWSEEEAYGDPVEIEVRAEGFQQTYSYIPYTKVITTYGEDKTWDPATCVISSSEGEGLDQSDTVLFRETERRVLFAEAANAYCSQIITAGGFVNPAIEANAKTIEVYEYDKEGTLTSQTTERYEPFFAWAGGIDITFVYANATGGNDYVTLGSDLVLVERIIETYETIYADVPEWKLIEAGEGAKPAVEGQKTTTVTYQNWMLTPQGQQAAAEIQQSAPFADDTDAVIWLNAVRRKLVQTDMQVRTSRRPSDAAGQVKPANTRMRTPDASARSVSKAEMIFAVGSAASQRVVTFSMPYQSDDIWSPTGRVIKSDAAAKALRYGRVQNQLLLGNRSGANLQLAPSKMPSAPFSPLFLSNGSLSVMYRANGISWAFSSEGIVSSVDALYWGVAGGTGTAWVPVAPGVTVFPPLPVPDANGDVTVPDVVPPWNELVKLLGRTRTTASVRSFVPLVKTERVSMITRTKALINAAEATVANVEAKTRTLASISVQNDPPAFLLAVTRTLAAINLLPENFAIVDSAAVPLGGSGLTSTTPAGWTEVFSGNQYSGDAGASSWAVTGMPFSFGLMNGTYNSLNVHPCFTITFGAGGRIDPPTSTNPAEPKIHLLARRLYTKKVFTKITTGTVRVRIEATETSTSFARVVEIAFFDPAKFAGRNLFEVRIGDTGSTSDYFNVYDSSSSIVTNSVTKAKQMSYIFESTDATGTSWTIARDVHVTPIE